jgi:hypothetical protein
MPRLPKKIKLLKYLNGLPAPERAIVSGQCFRAQRTCIEGFVFSVTEYASAVVTPLDLFFPRTIFSLERFSLTGDRGFRYVSIPV